MRDRAPLSASPPTAIPVHFAVDLEPADPYPAKGTDDLSTAGAAILHMQGERARLEDATGAPVRFGFYVRMDRQIADVFGDARALALAHESLLAQADASGDELGLHIHVGDRSPRSGRWRANYADKALVEDTIAASFDEFASVYGRSCRSARMGDLWLDETAVSALEAAGAEIDLSLESGLRPLNVATYHADRDGLGNRPSLRAAPAEAYQPHPDDFRRAGRDRKRKLWLIPLTSFPRDDYLNPRFWGAAANTAAQSRFRSFAPRDVLRPQNPMSPATIRRRLGAAAARLERPQYCFAIRNLGERDRITMFLNELAALARERPLRFVAPPEYLTLAVGCPLSSPAL